MELSNLQKEIINAPYDKVVVVASAASGKTATMTEKVRQILRAGVNPRQVAVITFTNMAAGELRKRLGADYKDGLFVGTIHSLANYMLSVGGVDTSKILNDERFDELFKLIEENPHCIRHLEWILLDEAQDSDPMQFKFLFDMINPERFFITGDPKQMIYGFKGSNSFLMMELAHRPGVHLFSMNENYRNGFNILKFAKQIIRPTRMVDDSIAMRKGNGAVAEIPFSLDTIINLVTQNEEYGNWAILTRTNAEIELVISRLKKEKIPYDTFKQGDLSNDELSEKLSQNTVKVLTVHSAKGLEFENVIVFGVRFAPTEERNVCYVAATRAKENLYWMSKKKQNTKMYKW